ncbi:MAG: amino acid adenylation domain-containing protein, partial [Gammaproteobacteria bacterium]|nr:amino acid adenylation domain-containing protein [Gammaproteobacteria bacterium]
MSNSALVKGFIQLPLDKRKVFFEKLTSKKISLTQLPIPAVKDEFNRIPLSYAQERLWVLWQLEPSSAAYNMPIALRLKGKLNLSALEKSFNNLIVRHDVLRTIFGQDDLGVYQIIKPEASITIEQETLESINYHNEAEQDEKIKACVINETQTAFDLLTGPLLKVKLLSINKNEYVLIMTQHHIISDGWSMQLMVDELIKAYSAYDLGNDVSLAELPIKYADYAIWQRCWMEAGEQTRQLDYWISQLGDEHPVLELPIDHSRPKIQSFNGKTLDIPLTVNLAKSLSNLAQQEGVTLFALLLASFQILLFRYSGQTDIRIGVPIANRNREETNKLIGFFVNTQVLKAEVDGQISFTDLLQQVKQTTIDAQSYQDLPFDQLVQGLQPERDMGNSPLFQVMYNHQSEQKDQLSINLGELDVRAVEFDNYTAKFDLTLDVSEHDDGISASFNYATDLFEPSTIERLAKHWQQLLQGIVAKPSERIAELPLLDQAEKKHIIEDWNDTAVSYDTEVCIHQLFEQQANINPDNTALVFDDKQLSYQTLNQKANQLAHKLRAQGVGPDVLVGIAVERSLEMVVGLLAILKAGGAYVPLDPDYPQERLAYMIEDSGIELLLTQGHTVPQLTMAKSVAGQTEAKFEIVLLDNIINTAALNDYSVENVKNITTPNNVAYVIYTSGSTGKPKGVLQTHHNVNRLLQATEQWFNFTDKDVWTLFHSYAFDFSIWEIFGAILHGGKLVVVPFDITRSASDFYNLLCKEKVTVLNQTPSAFAQLMPVACESSNEEKNTNEEHNAMALRYVVFGGEALDVSSLRPWFERFGDSAPKLVNMYGITETTVHVTYRPLSLADIDNTGSPIGQVINDLTWYVLDTDLNPVVKGCTGELHVGGLGLARGYHQRQGLTAERFIADPFNKSGGRLYRTGDLARYQADGTIEYVGRIDHQVKIRGFRIELGEIESQLQGNDAIRDAVVLAQEGNAGQQLVAYVIPNDSGLIETDNEAQNSFRSDIKNQLQQALPEYMVPAHMLLLEQFPLTPNGKLDRKALPKADASQLQQTYIAPSTELEKQLAQIWQDVLGIEQVGLSDNFFVLGGHSLLLTQVVSRVRQALSAEIPMRVMFEASDLHDFAVRVAQSEGVVSEVILPVSREQELPLSYAQQRQWVLWQIEPESTAYHMSS